MELRHYLNLGRRWWWLLVLGGVVAGASTYFFTAALPPVYRATATVFVNQTAQVGSITYSDALLNQQLVKTYVSMVQQPAVLQTAEQRVGLAFDNETLSRMVSARVLTGTQLFEISAQGANPTEMRNLANAIAAVFIEQQRTTIPAEQASGLSVAQEALLPSAPIGPRTLANTGLGILAGILLMAGFALLLEYLDDTVKTPEDLFQAAGLATLGAVFRFDSKEGPLSVRSNVRGPAAEAYRLVRTNLEFATVDHPVSTLLVTSASPSEGKTTTAANLAHVLGHAGKRVILIDGDLRRPSLHRLYGMSNERGLTSLLLTDDPDLDSLLRYDISEGVRVLTSGPLPPNPAELLSSSRLQHVLERLRAVSDVVIVDSPPILAAVDPLILASRVDATVLVVDTARTRSGAVRQASEALAKSGTRVLGGILNKLGKRAGSYYSEYYYSQYYAPSAESSPAPQHGASN